VLINGRRVADGVIGTNAEYFDVSSIPAAAVERIEVVPEGSSAVYGSDAIGGVINIILKKDFQGLALDAKYGSSNGTHDWDGDLT
jgi:iron complex outermembrane receptor protein